ncbi:MAG: cytochrome c1 [Gammaproteobacteria bacterium]|nr:cytochrome c1 [Gammaproteobacteria bacterium]
MKRTLATLCLLFGAVGAWGAEGTIPLEKAHSSIDDPASLQRGARIFVNYCLSCHAASYMRYNRMAKDLHLTEEMVQDNLMFTTDKIVDTMQVAMRSTDALKWFGVAPPDLSVIARARGTDWLYSFLLGFYADPARPNGVNNLVFKDTAMPHVLVGLQGIQQPVYRTEQDQFGEQKKVIERLELMSSGQLTEADYRRTVRDLVNFLHYVGEPAKLQRLALGKWVLLYLFVLLLVAYRLKAEYWKDVH